MNAAAYLERAWPMMGLNRVRKLLREKQVRINGVRSGEGSTISAGDRITVFYDGEYDFSLHFLYEDGFLTAFIKPDGLPVDKDRESIGEDTVLTRLTRMHPDARLVHRLDVFTSGVMLAALNEEAEAFLRGAFENHLLIKRYKACAVGKMPQKSDTLNGFILKDETKAFVRVSDKAEGPGALPIETRYTVIREENRNGATISYLDVEIPTGRTHQIRAHLKHIGHPLLGDDKYGSRAVNRQLNAARPQLVSAEIRFKNDPAAGKYAGMGFRLPEDET